ncbi:MAG: hypothetical protein Q4F71_08865 [Paracoccus sp. (in: a-proteobacteria)]|nr:hypothetical protein [Paracoccus sp. (in: a-proteobacteria)]
MIGRVLRGQRLLALAFVAAMLLTLGLGWRLVDRAIYWSDPAHLHQTPAPWMTVGYLARSWHIAPEELAEALDLPPERRRGRSFAEIAAMQGVPVSEVMARLNARLAEETIRAEKGRSPPPPEGEAVILPQPGPAPAPPEAAPVILPRTEGRAAPREGAAGSLQSAARVAPPLGPPP